MLTEAIISLGAIGFALGAGLSLAAKKFAVEVDPKEAAAQAVLPGANCGACGYPGCSGFAAAVARGEAPVNACVVGGEAVVKQLAAIMGVEASANEKKVAVIFCAGGNAEAKMKFEYYGAQDCRAAILVAGGNKACSNSCLGLASCVKVCPFEAMEMNENGLPVVFEDKCTGCGKCVEECPKQIISLIPISKKVHIRCSSRDKGAVVKKYCGVGCIACGSCVKICPFEAITLIDNLAQINYDKCTNCGLCVRVCPTHTIQDYMKERLKAFINEGCNGCTICAKVCPVDAISGNPKELHVVDPAKCIGCMMCVPRCPKKVIELVVPEEMLIGAKK